MIYTRGLTVGDYTANLKYFLYWPDIFDKKSNSVFIRCKYYCWCCWEWMSLWDKSVTECTVTCVCFMLHGYLYTINIYCYYLVFVVNFIEHRRLACENEHKFVPSFVYDKNLTTTYIASILYNCKFSTNRQHYLLVIFRHHYPLVKIYIPHGVESRPAIMMIVMCTCIFCRLLLKYSSVRQTLPTKKMDSEMKVRYKCKAAFFSIFFSKGASCNWEVLGLQPQGHYSLKDAILRI